MLVFWDASLIGFSRGCFLQYVFSPAKDVLVGRMRVHRTESGILVLASFLLCTVPNPCSFCAARSRGVFSATPFLYTPYGVHSLYNYQL
jgi:hypothetical protein